MEAGWRHTLTLHQTQVGLRLALEEAERDYLQDQSETSLARILELQQQLEGIQERGVELPPG